MPRGLAGHRFALLHPRRMWAPLADALGESFFSAGNPVAGCVAFFGANAHKCRGCVSDGSSDIGWEGEGPGDGLRHRAGFSTLVLLESAGYGGSPVILGRRPLPYPPVEFLAWCLLALVETSALIVQLNTHAASPVRSHE